MFELCAYIWFFSGNCRNRRTKFLMMIQRALKVLMRIIQSCLILAVTILTKVLVMNCLKLQAAFQESNTKSTEEVQSCIIDDQETLQLLQDIICRDGRDVDC